MKSLIKAIVIMNYSDDGHGTLCRHPAHLQMTSMHAAETADIWMFGSRVSYPDILCSSLPNLRSIVLEIPQKLARTWWTFYSGAVRLSKLLDIGRIDVLYFLTKPNDRRIHQCFGYDEEEDFGDKVSCSEEERGSFVLTEIDPCSTVADRPWAWEGHETKRILRVIRDEWKDTEEDAELTRPFERMALERQSN